MSENNEPKSDSAVPVVGLTPVRRAPRYGRFIFIGVLLGTIIGTALSWWDGRDNQAADAGTGFLSIFDGQGSAVFLTAFTGAVLGALIGALVAIGLARARRGTDQSTKQDNPTKPPVADKNVTA